MDLRPCLFLKCLIIFGKYLTIIVTGLRGEMCAAFVLFSQADTVLAFSFCLVNSQIIGFTPETVAAFIAVVGILSILAQVGFISLLSHLHLVI